MIKSRLLLLAVLVCGTAQAEDANTFYFTDAAVLPGWRLQSRFLVV
jgi:hypothetical protein